MINGLITVGAILVGGFTGWFGGLAACPDWGDIGIGALTWCVGGAAIGGIAGGGVAAAILS